MSSLIDGVGGAFLFSRDPARLARWYEEKLGVEWAAPGPPYYVAYHSRAEGEPERRLDTTFSILTLKVPEAPRTKLDDASEMYGDQPFMLNLRVRDLAAVLDHLRAKDVEILKHEDAGYGRFAWVRDADGNRVELYEPVDAK